MTINQNQIIDFIKNNNNIIKEDIYTDVTEKFLDSTFYTTWINFDTELGLIQIIIEHERLINDEEEMTQMIDYQVRMTDVDNDYDMTDITQQLDDDEVMNIIIDLYDEFAEYE